MKKELLLASALASTMGAAGIAEAASATFSGHTRVGVEGENPDSSDSDTVAAGLRACEFASNADILYSSSDESREIVTQHLKLRLRHRQAFRTCTSAAE